MSCLSVAAELAEDLSASSMFVEMENAKAATAVNQYELTENEFIPCILFLYVCSLQSLDYSYEEIYLLHFLFIVNKQQHTNNHPFHIFSDSSCLSRYE